MPDEHVLRHLCEPDQRTLPFGPLGLGGVLSPDLAARHQAATIEQAQLGQLVPEGIRKYFERVRQLHIYGVLEYEFFSAACDLSLFAIEAALRVRFVEHYSGRVPVTAKRRKTARPRGAIPARTTGGAQATLLARNFDDVWRAASGWLLGPVQGHSVVPIPTSLETLLAWARREGLLPGRRTRFVDQALADLRNFAAHPTSYTLRMPPDSSRSIVRAAELINKLWGLDTPAGRLFPGPVRREPRVVALARDGNGAAEMRLDQVTALQAPETEYDFGVFLAAPQEELLQLASYPRLAFAYRNGVQRTQYPCLQMFSGAWEDLVEKIGSGAFEHAGDSVDFLDRHFLLRVTDGTVDDARSPEDIAMLAEPLEGEWLAVVADSPLDARFHASQHSSIDLLLDRSCPDCLVEVAGRFIDWQSMIRFVEHW